MWQKLLKIFRIGFLSEQEARKKILLWKKGDSIYKFKEYIYEGTDGTHVFLTSPPPRSRESFKLTMKQAAKYVNFTHNKRMEDIEKQKMEKYMIELGQFHQTLEELNNDF